MDNKHVIEKLKKRNKEWMKRWHKLRDKISKDNLSRPFERALTKDQQKLLDEIKEICQQDFVINMNYPELFDVFDRCKLKYQLDMLKRNGLIKIRPVEDEIK